MSDPTWRKSKSLMHRLAVIDYTIRESNDPDKRREALLDLAQFETEHGRATTAELRAVRALRKAAKAEDRP